MFGSACPRRHGSLKVKHFVWREEQRQKPYVRIDMVAREQKQSWVRRDGKF